MRTFLILVCSVALACSAIAAQKDNKSKKQAQKNRQAQPTQHARPAGGPKKASAQALSASLNDSFISKGKRAAGRQQSGLSVESECKTGEKEFAASHCQNAQAGRYATKKTKQAQQGVNRQYYQSASNVKKAKKGSQQITAQNAQAGRYANSAAYSKKGKQWKGNTASAAAFQSNKKYKAQRFNLASNTRPTKYAAVKFQQNRRIQGSQNWQGRNYWAFRNYRSAWHDRGWWHSHYNRVVFVYGGWYAGIQAIGTRHGDTLPMRITLTMVRFMPITACHPIKWSPTSRPRCNSKAIIKAKWTACLGHLHARRLQLTRPNRAYTRPQPLISRHWNR